MGEEIFSLADQVIELLKERGNIELSQLTKEVGSDEGEVKEIAQLLERRGVIDIDYKWGKTILKWAGDLVLPGIIPKLGEEKEEERKEEKKERKEEKKEKKKERREEKKKEKKEEEKREKFLEKINDEIVKKEKGIEKEIKEVAIEKEKKIIELVSFEQPQTVPVEEIKEEEAESDGKALHTKLMERMDEVRKKKAEVEELNAKKANLLEEGYTPLSRKVEAELGIISAFLNEKEKKIKELRERLSKFPEKVGELDVGAVEIIIAEADARRKLSEAIEALDISLINIRVLQDKLQSEMEVAKQKFADQNSNLSELKKSLGSISEERDEIERRVVLMERRVGEELDDLSYLKEKIDALRATDEKLKRSMEEIGKEIVEIPGKVNGIERGVKKLSEFEDSVKKCREEYVKAMENTENEMKDYKKSLAILRESVEATLIQKYTEELDEIRREHEEGIIKLGTREEELNEKIAKTKEELSKLIQDSKELAERMRSELPKGEKISFVEERKAEIKEVKEPEEKRKQLLNKLKEIFKFK